MDLHETEDEVLKGYNSVFEMVGIMVVVENVRKTQIRFGNKKDFETYIISLDENGYESDDSIFTGCENYIETPVFNLVNRSGIGKGTGFQKYIVEVSRDICFIPI